MKKKIFGLFIALMMAVPAFASIAVSPTRIEINANKVRSNYATMAVEVKGDPVKVMRFKAYAEYFKVDEKADVIMIENSADPQNISKKIRFVPSEFVVQPGKSQKLRVNIANVKALVDGESRAMLYVEDVNPREYALPTGQAGIGAQLLVKTRIGIPIYVDKGNFSKTGDIESFSLTKEKGGIYTNLKVVSKGNSKIRYNTQIQIMQGKKLAKEYNLGEKVAAPGSFCISKDKLDISNIKEAGEYTVRATISYYDENMKRKNIKKEATLNIQGEK